MPVFANEENGVKPVILLSSDYIADIPIKKRRFPIIRTPSPPPEETSVENSLQKGQSSAFLSPTCSNVIAASSSSKLSDQNKNLEFEVRRGSSDIKIDQAVKDNSNYAKVEGHSSLLSDRNKDPESEVGRGSSDIKIDQAVKDNSNYAKVEGHSSKLSDQNKIPKSEVGIGSSDIKIDEAVKDNSNYAKVEGPSLQSGCLDGKSTKMKLESNESVAHQLISEKSKLNMLSTPSLALNPGNSDTIDQKAKVKVKTEISAQLENAEPSLTLDRHLASVLGGESNDKNDQNLDSSELISLNFSLSEVRSSNVCKKDDKLKFDRSHQCASRVNWDLNTTMDAWDGGPVSDAASGLMSVDRNKTSRGTLNMKPNICSTGMAGVPSNTDKHAAVTIPSMPSSQQHKSDGSVHLHLISSCPWPSKTYTPSTPSLKGDEVNFSGSIPRVSVSDRNLNAAVNLGTVKSEPADESKRPNPKGANTNDLKLLISRLKQELVERCSLEIQRSNTCARQLAGTRSIKPEPPFEGNKDTVKLLEKSTLQLNSQMIEHRNILAGAIAPPVVSDDTCYAEKTSCGTELTLRDHPDQSIQYTQTSQAQHIVKMPINPCENRPVCSDTDAKLLTVDGKADAVAAVSYGVDHPGILDVASNPAVCSSVNGEGSVSDEEKINLSGDMLEEDSYGSDYESDGSHALEDMAVDMEHDCGDNDDYEDGEVRDPPEGSTIHESMSGKEEVDQIDSGNCDNKKVDSMVLVSYADPSSVYPKENSFGAEDIAGTINQDDREISVAVCTDESYLVFGKNVCLPESSAVEKESSVDGSTGLVKITEQSLDKLGSNDVRKCQETGLHSELNNNDFEGTAVTNGQETEAIFGISELAQNEDPPFPKGSADGDHALNESSGASHRSRIINLPRSSTFSSPGKVGSMSGRWWSSRVGRDRLYDTINDGDKIQSQGRDDTYFNTNNKFSRERYQDRSARNSRINFTRGRGRIGRRDNRRGDWGSDRQRSPGWGQGTHMGRRIPRNISPGRCSSEKDSEVVGPRRRENFIRGIPGGTIDPMFSRTQPSYEGEDVRFDHRNRIFSAVQRRGPSRFRSKSPISSRNRSPGPWSSPRRRSPEVFDLHSNVIHRRSPPLCRMERMRSPDRPCFPGNGVVRRHDLRDMDSGQDHRHPRSANPSRSPSGRIIIRNRRFDSIETQVRLNGDEYFGDAIHSGRLHKLSGEGISDDRRRFGERCGPVRTLRPPYDVENFHLNPEDGPRPYRFCPKDDVEFQQRGNFRDREFDRRIKNRLGNARRRMRSIEEEDANYRHGGQVWHDDGFDDMCRLKRKRY